MQFVLSCLCFTIPALNGQQLNFDVNLSPDAIDGVVVPAGAHPSGEAVITYNPSTREVYYHVQWSGLSGPPTAMHFHGPAPTGQKAGVQLGIDVSANPATGSALLTEEQDQDLRAGLWYLNLHTEANPAGEIRGQVSMREGTYERAFPLSYAQHVNPVQLGDFHPTGNGWISLDPNTNTVKYVIQYAGLTGTPVAAHFHGAANFKENAGVALAIQDLGNPILGVASIDTAQAISLLSGLWYVNLHTPENPGGEIRGQVVESQEVHVFDFDVSADQVSPAPSIDGADPSGKVLAIYEPASMEFKWWLTYSGLTGAATAAHFHGPAAVGQSAGVQVGLPETDSGVIGQAVLTREQEEQLLGGLWYLNIHTAANPKGEIRGQVLRDANDLVYRNHLETGQVVNALDLGDATPSGSSIVVLDTVTREASWWIEWNGLTGEATNAHFHGSSRSGQQGGVVLGLGSFASPVTGRQEMTEEQAATLQGGFLYLNVHTARNKPGELRGQVLKTPWRGSLGAGSGWKWNSWFGFFHDGQLPWVYHVEHGWLYSVSDNPEDINLYLSGTGWIWTSSYIYPGYFNWQSGQWGVL